MHSIGWFMTLRWWSLTSIAISNTRQDIAAYRSVSKRRGSNWSRTVPSPCRFSPESEERVCLASAVKRSPCTHVCQGYNTCVYVCVWCTYDRRGRKRRWWLLWRRSRVERSGPRLRRPRETLAAVYKWAGEQRRFSLTLSRAHLSCVPYRSVRPPPPPPNGSPRAAAASYRQHSNDGARSVLAGSRIYVCAARKGADDYATDSYAHTVFGSRVYLIFW